MTRSHKLLILAAILAAGTGGFFFAQTGGRPTANVGANAPAGAVPASEGDQAAKASSSAAADSRRILYYRNPMGLPDVSQTPKKDSMGMDYIAVYEGEGHDPASVTLSPGKLQRAGVATEAVMLHIIAAPVRAPGTVQLDERKISVISVRTESFVDSVENVTNGTEVRRGQPLLRLYSPLIATAAGDYLASLTTPANVSAPAGARQRLLNYGVPQSMLAHIEKTRQVPPTFTWEAPRDGIVLERNVTDGMRANPGDVLFRIADHRTVWVLVDVAERDLAAVSENQAATVRVRSYPDRTFTGKIALVYPHLNPATRTVRVRIELPNTDLLLRPDMYAEAEISTGSDEPVLAVPDSAIIDSGSRQIVLVDKGDGRFEPRPVQLGRRGTGYAEVRDGLAEGEVVVTSANFLIAAESNLKAALKGFSDASAPQ